MARIERSDRCPRSTLTGRGRSVLADDDGEPFWFLNTLTINKLGGDDTQGGFSVVDHRMPAGFAPPPHLHHGTDEAFYVLDGRLEGFCGEQQWSAGPGTLVFLLADVPHGFRVTDDGPGRALLILAPAGFDRFVAALGEPAPDLRLPTPVEPDVSRVVELAAAHGIQILPPPDPNTSRIRGTTRVYGRGGADGGAAASHAWGCDVEAEPVRDCVDR